MSKESYRAADNLVMHAGMIAQDAARTLAGAGATSFMSSVDQEYVVQKARAKKDFADQLYAAAKKFRDEYGDFA